MTYQSNDPYRQVDRQPEGMPAAAMGFLALIFLLGLGIVFYSLSDGTSVTATNDATPPSTSGQAPNKPAPPPAPAR